MIRMRGAYADPPLEDAAAKLAKFAKGRGVSRQDRSV